MDSSQPARTKHYQAYYTPAEVDALSSQTRGKMTSAQEEKARQTACTFIEAVGSRIGFPRKTIATAQVLYHRFHLHFPRKDAPYTDVTVAALYVAAKIQDTLKKPRDILMASYAVLYPDRAAKIKAVGGEIDMDPATVESDRQRLLSIERLLLECVCFNFTLRLAFPYVIKFGRALQASRDLVGLAWRIAVDSHRTLAPLMYPPHVIALASLRMAALLSTSSSTSSSPAPEAASVSVATMLSAPGDWEKQHRVSLADLEDICHMLMDLFLLYAGGPSTSPAMSTPASPPAPWTAPTAADKLTRLKVAMRETDHEPRPRQSRKTTGLQDLELGKNEGTVRFLFGYE
ncbi:cyclin-like protein, partial [Exidia glandulosa HHB12029]